VSANRHIGASAFAKRHQLRPDLLFIMAGSTSDLPSLDAYRPTRRPTNALLLAPLSVVAAALLLGACASTDTVKKNDPVFFGTGGAGRGGGGATGGMSFRW